MARCDGLQLTIKIHTVVNEAGLPIRFVLTAGQASDKTTVPVLLEGLPPAPDIVADRGDSAKAVIDCCAERGATAHMPSAMFRRRTRFRQALAQTP